MTVLGVIGVLVALPGAIWAVFQIVDRLRYGPDRK